MKKPTDVELRNARADFQAMLARPTAECAWQAFFAQNPFVLSRSLPLRLEPCDILPLGRPWHSEPDFVIYPGSSLSAPIHGVIELKNHAAPITSVVRKGLLTLTREAATGIQQLRAYERDYDAFSPVKRCISLSIQSHLFLIMGRQQEIEGRCHDLDLVTQLRDVFPRDIRILTYDQLLRQYERGLRHRPFILLSDVLSGTRHMFQGIEPDNLLAFLALLGTLRSLEASRPQWNARVYWDAESSPLRPMLTLSEPRTVTELAEAVARGCDLLVKDYCFDVFEVSKMRLDDARRLLHEAISKGPAGRPYIEMLSSLMCDVANDDGCALLTPLYPLFRQCHEHFLRRHVVTPKQRSAPPRGSGTDKATPTASKTIEAALFHAWHRADTGANRLAAVGLPVLTLSPATVRVRLGLRTVGVQQTRGKPHPVWPIWTRPLSLPSVKALLSHPGLYEGEDSDARSHLHSLGVLEVQRATMPA